MEVSCSRLRLRGTTYQLRISTTVGEQLHISLDDCDREQRWSGTFGALYLEEVTHKAGHFQSFAAFVQLLHSSLTDACDAAGNVSMLDVLTYADLQALKNRRNPTVPPPNYNNKRYLILTHIGRERVHYPLPLAASPKERSRNQPVAAPYERFVRPAK